MADALHQHSAGHDQSAHAVRSRNPLLPNNHVQEQVLQMAQRTTGVRPTPRKRGRPRKPRDPSVNKRKRVQIPDKDRQRMVDWTAENKTAKEISTLLGYSINSVRSVVRRFRETGRINRVDRHIVSATSKFTDDMKLFICALVLLENEITLPQVQHVAQLEYPDISISISSIRNILEEGRITVKSVVVRKVSWNTPKTLESRRSYPDFTIDLADYLVVYYDEQNYNVHMHRRRGRSVRGTKPVVARPDRTSGGGAVSLHLAITKEHGVLHAMVVSKDADQVTTRQFFEGLVDSLIVAQAEHGPGDRRPVLLVMDNDKQHHTAHVTRFLVRSR